MLGRDLLEADAVRAFEVFAEHRSFTAAAAVLHLSQPSLHAKIGRLQTALGVPLYERHGRGLRLTVAGERLAVFARDAGRRADDLVAQLHAGAAPITLAAGRGTFRWVVSDGLRRLGATGRPVRVRTADREAALGAVTSGQVDVAVVAHDRPPPALESRQIAVYPQTLVVARRHPLARRGSVRVVDLDGLALVVPPPERVHRRTLERALGDAGVSWQVAAEVDGWDLLVHFAAIGLGATVVNGCVRPPRGLVAVPIEDLPVVRYWAAWRPERGALADDVLEHLVPAQAPA
ncbi:LysR family transcriptional regulator [Kineosporia sp. R_H_3]|uniref:LysR family transcriptional regulator n=1 Tax=Kineosporia sp. R_H_3 TaxID=1961848 RepID=UPI000B4B1420|nr:LysR family transcriptional regulator [Kineosporia sp. R_H_3]